MKGFIHLRCVKNKSVIIIQIINKFRRIELNSAIIGQEEQSYNQNEKSSNNSNTNYTEKDYEELIQKSRMISHQLNNLLTAIIANIQLANLINKDEEKQELLKTVEDAALNASETILEFQKFIRSIQK